MLRNMSREEHFSGGGQTSPSLASLSPSLRHGNQDSSWISSISRPALSFLQKYLPGRSQTTPARAGDGLSGWVSGDFKQNLGLVDGESAFFGQLDGIMPATTLQSPRHHLAYLHCQHEASVGSVGSGAPGSTSTLSWLTADSLRELGIENAAEIDLNIRQQTPVGYLATARSFLNHVLLNSASAQEIRTTEQMHHVLGGDGWPSDAVTATRAKSNGGGNWWAGFWGTEEHRAQGWLSNLSWSKEETGVSARRHSGDHCPPLESGTKATVAMPTELFVQCSDEESMESESPGPSGHKEEATDNYGLTLTPRPESLPSSEELPFDQRPCITTDSRHLSAGAVTACSEVAVLTPDQDNGYSSLEEEHSACRLFMLKPPFDLQGPTEIQGDTITPGCSGEREPEREEASEKGEEGETATGEMEEEEEEEAEEEEEEEMDDSDLTDSEEDEEEETVTMGTQSPAATPRCQNKAIAYIMGSPCSDDSQSDDELSEDDDGFDSEGSSELSDSDDDDDDNEDEEEEEEEESDSDQADPETERLWNSLCQSRDPYNPQNFTASIHSAPRTAPDPPCRAATTSSHQHASPPSHQPSPTPLLSSSSSPSPLLEEDHNDFGDESTASEADEAESLRLWNSFSASSDPYSPMNFQAPLRTTQEATPGPAGRRSRKARTRHGSSPPQYGSSAPQYRTEEAEERLDSGFSESLPVPVTTTTTTSWVTVKKVCFCEDVEEFYASGDEEEDRRGPWEELARDRCRFLRRVQEVEDAIAYVLAPAFRRGVLHKLQHCS